MSRDISPFGLRMPHDLRAALERSAKDAGRSLNMEIVKRLEESVQSERRLSLLAKESPLHAIMIAKEMITQALKIIGEAAAQLGTDSGREPPPGQGSGP